MIVICMLTTQLQDSIQPAFPLFFLFFQDNMGADQGKASVSLCGYGH